MKINKKNTKNKINNQDCVSSAVAHNKIDWEEAILNDSNLLDNTKPFQEFFFTGTVIYERGAFNSGGTMGGFGIIHRCGFNNDCCFNRHPFCTTLSIVCPKNLTQILFQLRGHRVSYLRGPKVTKRCSVV